MGPFPHDAPPATVSAENPMGTDGFEFVEYAHPNPEELHTLFRLMGFAPVARHKTKKITVYRQGDVNYLVNEEPGTHGFNFVAAHGPCAPSMAFRVVDSKQAYERAIALGADRRFRNEVAQRTRPAQAPEARAAGGRDGQFRHCMASKMPSKLGSRASAVTASPARRAAAVVDGPIA